MKEVIMIGGPNGAGKTTWALKHLLTMFDIREFINADEIARGLSPLKPESSALSAGRMMINRLNELLEIGDSFAFETTCSGKGHGRLLERARSLGYRTTLVYLWLPSADVALDRVAKRVSEGGHCIPDPVILRRYAASVRNMQFLYLPLADVALIYDNSDGKGTLIAERRGNGPFVIHDGGRWRQIEQATP